MNSNISIFCSIPGLAVLVDQTIETTSDFHSKRMTERFVANNYFLNWFTVEFVHANNVDLEEYLFQIFTGFVYCKYGENYMSKQSICNLIHA